MATQSYDPPVKGIHPPPPNRSTCKDRECHLGYACRFVHEDLVYDLPLKKSKSVKNIVDKDPEPRGLIGPIETVAKQIPFAHNRIPDTPADKRLVPTRVSYNAAKVHATGVEITPVDEGLNDPPVGMRPPPKYSETCVPWLRGICRARYKCYYRHDDLEYDSLNDRHVVTKLQPPSNPVPDRNLPREPQAWMVKVHDHARVKLGAGFEIQGLETGFETPWIYLGNIPSHVTTEDIATLLHPFGEVVDVKFPARINSNMLVRARFSTSEAAREANTSLNGIQMFGCKLSARLPIHSISHQDTLLQDTSVRIKWEVPSMVAYCGYPTMEQANEAIAVASCTPFRDRYLHGTIYAGLPAVGVITVRFRGVPLHTTKEAMAWLAKPDDIVWARPNYKNLDNATKNIKAILEQDTELTSFVVLPPPYKSGGLVQAWAHFNTPTDAKAASGRLNGRKPVFTGRTRINAQHIQSLSLSVEPAKFDKLRSDIDALSRTAYQSHKGADVSVVRRPPPQSILIKVSGEDLKAVSQLKLELEKILNWEIVRHGPNFAWDPFFAHPAGISFLQAIEREIPGVSISANVMRRTISLLGCSKLRTRVRHRILDKVEELRAQTIHIISLESRIMGIFIKGDLRKLQAQLGSDNVNLDLRQRQLAIRGGETQYQLARDAVARACQAHRPPARRRNIVECPVCFDEVTNPVTLPCGHAWCRECLSRYLKSSVDNKYFPLTCLGSNAKCTEHIPLHIARRLLNDSEFDTIVDAAFAAHVQSHTDEFHYCPTPDCRQIYRPAPRDTVLQCPSCLLRICPSCHVEAHDGFACPDPEADNKLFREWMRSNDVKPCPGCKIPIERAEGCNHMTCTQCKTHSCWVCLQTFPKGDGIYDHMRAKHGGIGLADD
ncbi:hypothetical protein H0H81_003947 [Sphagnurus paluster]|uniref:RBR-type E3 ubiquitin transferase n=1 Tax=Sphagnurus paluster TaxID=117069 RepID=A0A9P7FT20_9AGAR|nr:hypothetical protein H0H81_003947 [Sphagnurus paluster]